MCQELGFLTGIPENSLPTLWNRRHLGRFPDTPADTDTARTPLLPTTFLGKSQLNELMHAPASERKNTFSWQVKCTRIDRRCARRPGRARKKTIFVQHSGCAVLRAAEGGPLKEEPWR
jgi:hypothetical protein